jgi:glutamyl-tRNA synthetase
MDKSDSGMVVRMAPSPTGNLHIGTARTTLFNFLFAKKNGAKFILRIEDTDEERSTKEYEKNILDGLAWLGLGYDEFHRQSERKGVYRKYIEQMIQNGSAYISKETAEGENKRDEVIRFKNPNTRIVFEDIIRGTVEFDTTELEDFVIAKSLEEPLYHLAVVIDDHEMGVTHIIRGEDHISNTPRQILIQEAIGAKRPTYAHIPLIFDNERKKLSKRKHGEAVWVDSYREQGFLPEAFLNYLALLGWNPGTDEEIFSREELISKFDLTRVQKGGAIFDIKKLRWINREHLKRLPEEEIQTLIRAKMTEAFPGKDISQDLVSIIFERIEVWSDIDLMIREGELSYFFENPSLESEKIAWKTDSKEAAAKHLREVVEIIKQEKDIMAYADEVGKGSVLWPLRYALSGREKSPDPFTLMKVLGKDESLKRVEKAIEILNER